MLEGEQIGPFLIEQELGSGAMGTVYRARYAKNEQVVAIKVIALNLLGNETALKRFMHEAKILEQLRHPNIVRLFGTGKYKKMPYFAMEYVEGESLDRVLERRDRFTWEEVVELGRQVCAALEHAHALQIVHRDLKPSNLMVLPDGTVKLTDFGIAKGQDLTALTGDRHTVGTAAYMSPEQCRGEKLLTAKSDIYSLGVVFYELLTGRKPFNAESPIDMFLSHVQGTFERPGRLVLDVPPWLDTLVCQMLEKKPEHRPRDAQMVAKALDEVAEKMAAGRSAGVEAATARVVDRRLQDFRPDADDKEAARALQEAVTTKKKRKKKSVPLLEQTWLKALGLLAALAGVGVLIWYFSRPPGADALYASAAAKMKSEETYADALTALDGSDGPVPRFLRRFPDDPRADEVRAWQELAEIDRPYRTLQAKARAARKLLRPPSAESAYEETGLRAVLAEDFGDLFLAQHLWDDLRQGAEKDEPLLARVGEWRVRKLAPEVEALKAPDEKQFRRDLVQKKLAEAVDDRAKKENRKADGICYAIVELYADAAKTDAELAKAVDAAKELRGENKK